MKPARPIYKYNDVMTQYAVVGHVIKVYNSKSLDVAVYDVETGEWTEEEDSVTGMNSMGMFVY